MSASAEGDLTARLAEGDLTARLHDQCAFETEVAALLRQADREERARLYGQVYTEYAEKFPESLPKDSTKAERIASYEAAFLRRFITPRTVMVEIGPGRCHLAFTLAPLVQKIYGVDVSALDTAAAPPNFELRLTDGLHLPFEDNSVDLVVSNQLMEHLHPDDAREQLNEVYRILRSGGGYICITPNRTNGPHDCSAYFDDLPCPIQRGTYRATGLHLKEYTSGELIASFKEVGFRHVQTFIGARGKYLPLPPSAITLIETALRLIPAGRRKRSQLLSVILGNRMYATK